MKFSWLKDYRANGEVGPSHLTGSAQLREGDCVFITCEGWELQGREQLADPAGAGRSDA
jgi:hypothetical protein